MDIIMDINDKFILLTFIIIILSYIMSVNNKLIFWGVTASIMAALPIPIIKYYTETKEPTLIIIVIMIYIILVFAYIHLLDNQNITIVYPLLKIFSIIIVVLFGLTVFQNKLNIYSSLGLILGITSIYLLSKN